MTRPLRLEFPGAIYHLTNRGNARQDIFADDDDRERFLTILADSVRRFNWICHAYCLMGNHYHLLMETLDPNVSRGMRQLNGMYTQAFNRRHSCVGHVFQGRYKSILVEKDAHLLELCRYIVLNPVAAGMVTLPEQWPWSSYRQTVSGARRVEFLACDWILAQFSSNNAQARQAYAQFVEEGAYSQPPWQKLQGQIFFGSPAFVSTFTDLIEANKANSEIPKQQRYLSRPQLTVLLSGFASRVERNARIVQAHTCGYTLKEIADSLKIHYTTVSKMRITTVRKVDNSRPDPIHYIHQLNILQEAHQLIY